MRGSWVIIASLVVGLVGACDSEDPLDDNAGGKGGSAGKDGGSGTAGAGGSGGSSAAGGSSGSGGTAGSGGASCGSCGDARTKGTCGAKVGACLGDPGCKAIRDCVYGSVVGCALGEAGAKCAEECIATHCTTALSGKLFLEAERCVYCEGDCSDLCQTYCGAFTLTPDTVTCSNPIDAGPDATDADADADGATDAPVAD